MDHGHLPAAAAVNVLLLGGTAEAPTARGRRRARPGIALTSSLAGAVAVPLLPEGRRADRRLRRGRRAHGLAARPRHRRRRRRHPPVRDADDGRRDRRHGRAAPAVARAAQARLDRGARRPTGTGCRTSPRPPRWRRSSANACSSRSGPAASPPSPTRRAGSCCARSTRPPAAARAAPARPRPWPVHRRRRACPAARAPHRGGGLPGQRRRPHRGQARRRPRAGPSRRHGGPARPHPTGCDRRSRRPWRSSTRRTWLSLPLTGELGPHPHQADRAPGVKRSSTASAAASSAAVSDVGSGSVMLRVFVVNGANRTLTPDARGGPALGPHVVGDASGERRGGGLHVRPLGEIGGEGLLPPVRAGDPRLAAHLDPADARARAARTRGRARGRARRRAPPGRRRPARPRWRGRARRASRRSSRRCPTAPASAGGPSPRSSSAR